jgi:hypothetical protein
MEPFMELSSKRRSLAAVIADPNCGSGTGDERREADALAVPRATGLP